MEMDSNTNMLISIERHLYQETGKTSPLSDLPTSSPALYKNDKPMTTDQPPSSDTKETNGDSKEERSKSIVSVESSDLSELDSEAETERMYDGESQLAKIAKREDDTTLHDDHEEDTVIKEEYIDQLDEDKDDEIEVDANENFEKVVEDLKKSEEPEEQADVKKENGDTEDVKKRKLSSSSPEPIKRRKTEDEEEEQTDNANGVLTKNLDRATNEKKTEGEDENANEAEDEDLEEEDEEEEEEEELTEEQKAEKQKELEIELEKQKERKEAIQFLTEIEIDFAKLRDRLYEDKMARFKSELEMCLNGSHPELQNVYSKIDSHREEKIRLASLSQKYKFECIDRKTRAQRTSIHQQFFKRSSDFKSSYLKEITQEWYKINKERRIMDSLVPEYSYKIPEFVEDLVDQRAQVNEEISILTGLKKYYGFPRAPELKSIEGQELNDDLKAMNIL